MVDAVDEVRRELDLPALQHVAPPGEFLRLHAFLRLRRSMLVALGPIPVGPPGFGRLRTRDTASEFIVCCLRSLHSRGPAWLEIAAPSSVAATSSYSP